MAIFSNGLKLTPQVARFAIAEAMAILARLSNNIFSPHTSLKVIGTIRSAVLKYIATLPRHIEHVVGTMTLVFLESSQAGRGQQNPSGPPT